MQTTNMTNTSHRILPSVHNVVSVLAMRRIKYASKLLSTLNAFLSHFCRMTPSLLRAQTNRFAHDFFFVFKPWKESTLYSRIIHIFVERCKILIYVSISNDMYGIAGVTRYASNKFQMLLRQYLRIHERNVACSLAQQQKWRAKWDFSNFFIHTISRIELCAQEYLYLVACKIQNSMIISINANDWCNYSVCLIDRRFQRCLEWCK